jgi:hypothetical protein
MAVIELVDFNTGQEPAAKKTEKPARKAAPKRKAPKKKVEAAATTKAETATPAPKAESR